MSDAHDFLIAIELDEPRDAAIAAYDAVCAALQAAGYRFAARLSDVPKAPATRVICAKNTLWKMTA